MYKDLFQGLFDSSLVSVIGVDRFLLCVAVSLILGILIALAYIYKTRYTKSFVITIAMLPAVVCVVIMMVNGNVGTGVAVAGAFSLVRFRSAPGTAREIGMLFLAMSAGLIAGMGYLGYAVLFTVIMAFAFVLFNTIFFEKSKQTQRYKTLRIVIPENLDYTGVFEDVFSEYLSSVDLVSVKTTNMGSMFKLTYDIVLKDVLREKEMIDKLRCRNGNLEINISNMSTIQETL